MKRLALLFFALFLATPLAYAMEAEWEGYGAFGDVEAFYHTESWNDFHAQKIPSDFANLLLWINNLQEFIERGNVSAKAFYQSKKSYIDTMTAQPGFEPQQIRFREVAGEIESFLSKKHLSSLPKAGGYVPPPPPPPMYGYGVGFGGVLPPVAILKPDQLPSGRPPAPSLPKQVLGAGLGGMHMPPVTVVTPPPYPFPGYGHGTGFGGGMPKPPVTFFSPPAVVPDLPADLVLEGKIQKFIDGGMTKYEGRYDAIRDDYVLEPKPVARPTVIVDGKRFFVYANGADGDCGLYAIGVDPAAARSLTIDERAIPNAVYAQLSEFWGSRKEVVVQMQGAAANLSTPYESIDAYTLACIAYCFGKNVTICAEHQPPIVVNENRADPVMHYVYFDGAGHFERMVEEGDILGRIRAKAIEDKTLPLAYEIQQQSQSFDEFSPQIKELRHQYEQAQYMDSDQALGEFARAYAEAVPNVRQVAAQMAAKRGYGAAHGVLAGDSSDDEDAPHGYGKGSSYGGVLPPPLARASARDSWDDEEDDFRGAVPLYKTGFGHGSMTGYGAGGHGMHHGVGFGTGYSATGGGYGGMAPHHKPTYDLSKTLLGESDKFDHYVEEHGVPGQLGYPPHVPPATSGGGYPPFSAKGHDTGGYEGEAYTSPGYGGVGATVVNQPFTDRILRDLSPDSHENWQTFYGKLFRDNGAVQPERAFLIGHNHSLFHPKNGNSIGRNAMTALLNECQRKGLGAGLIDPEKNTRRKPITLCALDAVSIMADSFYYAASNNMYACSNAAEDEGLAKNVTGILFTGGEFGIRQTQATHDEFEQILDALYQATTYMTLDDIYNLMTPRPRIANARLQQHQHNMFLCAAMMWGQGKAQRNPAAGINAQTIIGEISGKTGQIPIEVLDEIEALEKRFGSQIIRGNKGEIRRYYADLYS